MKRTYICECCKGEYCSSADWSEADALAEKQINFPDVPMEEMVRICDDCFHKIMAFSNHKPSKRFG